MPKTSDRAELEETVWRLKRAGVRYHDLVVTVETVRGVQTFGAICATARKLGVRWVTYGHLDYSLDAGHFPFLQPIHREYWEWINGFKSTAEAAGLTFIHDPFLDLEDAAGLAAYLSRIDSGSQRPYAINTLSLFQADSCLAHQPGAGVGQALTPLVRVGYEAEHVLKSARVTCESYVAHWRPGLSFVLVPHSGRFISPHEFKSARAFLDKKGREV